MTKTISSLFALTLVAASLFAGSALACDTCGCRDAATAPAACDCGMPDGECACEVPEAGMHAHGTESLPDWHAKSPAGLNVSMQQLEAFDVAYLPATFADDMETRYGQLMASAGQQGLLGETTRVGAFMPGVLSTAPTAETVINVAIWNTADAQPSEPLMLATIPGGTYMVVEHYGDYDQLGETYMSTIEWAMESGIELSDQPSFVYHVNDPSASPVEEWLTEIYLPFVHSATATAGSGSGHVG